MINQIHLGDSCDILKTIGDNSISIIVSSPPYKNSDNYTEELIQTVFTECFRVLKNNSLFFLNFGSLAEDKFRPFRVCQMALETGFKLNDTITWVKNHYRPIQGKRRLNNLSEFIFLLYKGEMPELDRLSIGIPYVDKTNAKRFAGGRDLKCRGNVWYIDYETINSADEKLHNDRFPEELSRTCLKLSGLKKGIVFEPFAGSGTTCLSAKLLGLDYIGIEKSPTNYDIAVKRLNP